MPLTYVFVKLSPMACGLFPNVPDFWSSAFFIISIPNTLPAPGYPDICVLLLFLTSFKFCCCCYVCGCCYLTGSRVALQCYITKWIGCHCCCLVAQSCPPLCDPRNSSPPASSLSPLLSWDFPARSLRVGCRFLLQGIFSAQGLNLDSKSAAL